MMLAPSAAHADAQGRSGHMVQPPSSGSMMGVSKAFPKTPVAGASVCGGHASMHALHLVHWAANEISSIAPGGRKRVGNSGAGGGGSRSVFSRCLDTPWAWPMAYPMERASPKPSLFRSISRREIGFFSSMNIPAGNDW